VEYLPFTGIRVGNVEGGECPVFGYLEPRSLHNVGAPVQLPCAGWSVDPWVGPHRVCAGWSVDPWVGPHHVCWLVRRPVGRTSPCVCWLVRGPVGRTLPCVLAGPWTRGSDLTVCVLVGRWTRGSDLAMCAGWSVDPRVGRAPPRDRCIIVETPPGSSVDDPRATATPRNFTPHYLPVICPQEITNAEVRVWVMVKVWGSI